METLKYLFIRVRHNRYIYQFNCRDVFLFDIKMYQHGTIFSLNNRMFIYMVWKWETIVEETLTAGKYVSLFLISTLYIYIYNLNIYATTCIFFEEITQTLTIRENYASEEIKCIIFLIICKWQHQLPKYTGHNKIVSK